MAVLTTCRFPSAMRLSFMIIVTAVIVVFAVIWFAEPDAQKRVSHGPGYYGYGQIATPEEIAGWDIDVRPDGLGLPPGSGSVEDGEYIYEKQCAECHGSFGEGVDRFPILAGGMGTLQAERPTKTIGSYWAHLSTLWDYTHRAMPFTEPESLTDNEVYAVVAYLLYLNELVDYEFELSQDNFSSITLPNNGNFIPEERPDVINSRCMTDCRDTDSISILSAAVPITVEEEALLAEDTGNASGERVYQQSCGLCHDRGVGGAPALGDQTHWKNRIEKGNQVLIRNAIEGFTGESGYMPPRGGFSHLSETEIANAVEFIVEKSQ